MSIDISIDIAGQNGLTWPRWQRLVHAAEDFGFHGLYRSDHFTNMQGPILDQLETWVSFTWLAANTSRITFGPLVSPLSFRHPSILAWQANGVDALASGRLRLGLGAGWQDREHESFGFDLLDLNGRFARFEEGIQVVKMLTRSTEPVSFEGTYFTLTDAQLSPRSPHPDGPPLVIGGNGTKRTLPLVARYADEWNAMSLGVREFATRCQLLDQLLVNEQRDPRSLKRTLMTRCVVGRDDAAVMAKIDHQSRDELQAQGGIVGTPTEVVDVLGRFAEVGLQGVMLQWLEMEDIAGLELLASDVLPQFSA